MTANDYWLKQLETATHFTPPNMGSGPIERPDSQIVAALLVAHQLRDLVTQLSEIRAQLVQIEDSISN